MRGRPGPLGPHGAGALAFRRSTAVFAEAVTPRPRPGPRFLESPDANGSTLSGTSAAGTLQSDHAPDGTMPKPPADKSDEPCPQEPHPLRQSASPVDVPHDEQDYVRYYILGILSMKKWAPL